MNRTLSIEKIAELNSRGRHCSQVVAGAWAERLGLDKDTVLRIISPFGGGGFHGEMCGAISGALAMIGAVYATSKLDDQEKDAVMIEKVREFESRFEERFGSIVCRELLKEYGVDYAREGDRERAKETDASDRICRPCMRGALEILEDMLGAEVLEDEV